MGTNEMNFMQAVELMKQGKKVRRKEWYEDYYIYRSINSYVYDKYLKNIELNTDLIEATDWEIYDDEDNWTLAKCGTTWLNSSCREDVKTFIQKIKEDWCHYCRSEIGLIDNNPIININLRDKFYEIVNKRVGDL